MWQQVIRHYLFIIHHVGELLSYPYLMYISKIFLKYGKSAILVKIQKLEIRLWYSESKMVAGVYLRRCHSAAFSQPLQCIVYLHPRSKFRTVTWRKAQDFDSKWHLVDLKCFAVRTTHRQERGASTDTHPWEVQCLQLIARAITDGAGSTS